MLFRIKGLSLWICFSVVSLLIFISVSYAEDLPLCCEPKDFPYSKVLPQKAFIVDYVPFEKDLSIVFYLIDIQHEPCDAWWHKDKIGQGDSCLNVIGTPFLALVKVNTAPQLISNVAVDKEDLGDLDQYFGIERGDFNCDGVAQEVSLESNISHSGTPDSVFHIYGYSDGALNHFGSLHGRRMECRDGQIWMHGHNPASGYWIRIYRFIDRGYKELSYFSNHLATLYDGKIYNWPDKIFPEDFKGTFSARFHFRENDPSSPPVVVWVFYTNRPVVSGVTTGPAELLYVKLHPEPIIKHQKHIDSLRLDWKECSQGRDWFSVSCKAEACEGYYTCDWSEWKDPKKIEYKVKKTKIYFCYDPEKGFTLLDKTTDKNYRELGK